MNKIGKQIIRFLIAITIINAILTFTWFLVRFFPLINDVSEFKEKVIIELDKEYTSIDSLIYNLNKLLENKKISFIIQDKDKNIINEDNGEISLFTDFININNETYFITFTSSKNVSISRFITECLLFQIFEVTMLFLLTYILSRNKIIKPTESIIEDIKNYNFGKKIKRKELNNDYGVIQNEFVNLTDKLDEEKLAQNRIIASISHDIKTPLTSIIGYADLINDESDIKEIKNYNNKIVDKALHIKDLLITFDDYLVNYDNNKLKLTKVLIKDLVNELNNDYKIELENNNINFEINTKIENEVIEMDILKIKRVFSNLISNSTRYIRENGKITIDVSMNDKEYIFTISDNGIGVKEEEINKIFSPFYTTDKSRKISGLGLSICKEFIEMHEGCISASNNNGLIIMFTIPKR